MNDNSASSSSSVRARFGPEVSFNVFPKPSPFRVGLENELERLKRKLLEEKLDDVWDAETNSQLRRAANEAASLAWVNAYPLLVFPELFEEKTLAAVKQIERQDHVRRVTRELLAV